MKRISTIALILVLALSILTGCGGPDLTGVTQKYNEVSEAFNETGEILKTNGWDMDDEMVQTHNEIADAIDSIREILEDPEQSKNIDVETLAADLDNMLLGLEEYKEAVSVPYPYLIDLAKLEVVCNEMVVLHTQVFEVSEANGLLEDEKYVASMNEIYDAIEENLKIVEDPSSLEGSYLTQGDIDSRVELLEAYGSIMKDTLATLGVPAN